MHSNSGVVNRLFAVLTDGGAYDNSHNSTGVIQVMTYHAHEEMLIVYLMWFSLCLC